MCVQAHRRESLDILYGTAVPYRAVPYRGDPCRPDGGAAAGLSVARFNCACTVLFVVACAVLMEAACAALVAFNTGVGACHSLWVHSL
eukprot:356022-Chlamydomonas_euryale.AAC.2